MATKSRPVLVLGSTGKTGRRLVPLLRDKGIEVRAASRSAETVFDWDDRATWDPALSGAGAVYVVDVQDKPGQWDAESTLREFYARAVAAGVERLVVLQARAVGLVGGKDLHSGETAARESGAGWTILRPNWFDQNFDEGVLLDGVLAGELPLPAGDGVEPFIDVADVAAVAAAALTEPGHSERIYELSGPEPLSFHAAVATISSVTGRTVKYLPVSQEEYEAELVEYGVAADYAAFVGGLVGQIRDGVSGGVTGTVADVLGRAPTGFDEFARTAAKRGAWQL